MQVFPPGVVVTEPTEMAVTFLLLGLQNATNTYEDALLSSMQAPEDVAAKRGLSVEAITG